MNLIKLTYSNYLKKFINEKGLYINNTCQDSLNQVT